MSEISEKTIEERVMEIPDEEIVGPTIPVKAMIAEAADLHRNATEDKIALLNKGLKEELIEELKERAQFLQDKESDWHAKYETALTNTRLWDMKVTEATGLQQELKHDFLFAFRKNATALRKLQNIIDGNGNADLMQDLSDYPKLAAEYPDELTAINFESSKLVKADALCNELFELRNQVDGMKNSSKRPEKQMRDRAFTYLKKLMDEIRDYGKYAFWDQEEYVKRYASQYQREKYQRHIREENVTELEDL